MEKEGRNHTAAAVARPNDKRKAMRSGDNSK